MIQSTKAKELNMSLSTYKRAKQQIKQGDLFRKPILKILEVQGKGDIVRAFVKAVNDEE
jgi:hypothetical protein